MNLLFDLFTPFLKLAFYHRWRLCHASPDQKEVIETHAWLTTEEFMEVLAIAEMTPAPLPSTRPPLWLSLARIPGAVLGTAGCIASLIIITIIAAYFVQYNISEIPRLGRLYGPAAGSYWPNCLGRFCLGKKGIIDLRSALIAGAVFVVLTITDIHPIFVLLVTGILGGVFSLACLSMGVRMRCWRSWLPWKNAMKN